MTDLRLGINLWSQASDWPAFLDAGRRAEALGYDHVWTWDHLYAIFGDPLQPIFEGTTALAALAQATERVRLGLFVGANTFRNPGLAAKAVTTIDHISGVEVLNLTANVENGKIVEYKANVKVAFAVDRDRRGK